MVSRIEPIRRSDLARSAARPDPQQPEAAKASEPARLPVPVGRVERISPRRQDGSDQAVFAAQLIGQDGARRGLRAGPEAFDRARTVYNRTEWSGSKDRRAAKGANASTQA